MPRSEEDIVQQLEERFEGIDVSIQRPRRIWLTWPREGFIELLTYLKDELGFVSLCTVSGVDAGEKFQLLYHVSHSCGIVITARVCAPRSNPVFDTATEVYKGGTLYELEARNLLGLTIVGIPEDISYPLPDNWPEGQYPLRKDWTASAVEGAATDGEDVGAADAEAATDGTAATETGAAGDEDGATATEAAAATKENDHG